MTKVSVVIPTYNRHGMVEEAIESVLAQTLDDVEIVVVDDGSTDGTGDVLKARFDERIRYFYQENQGRSVARNRGARASTGEYVVFLDSDDLLMPHGLQTMAAFLDRSPTVDVVYADGYFCDQEGNDIELVSKGRPLVNHDNILETLVLHNIIGSPHLAMVRRRSLEKLGYPYFNESLHGTEDSDLWVRLAGQGCAFRSLDALVGKYRLHGSGNASSPLSPNFSEHWGSLKRFKYDIYNAPYFPNLSVRTRKVFVHQLLLVFLRGEIGEQEDVLNASQFQSLPAKDRAALLYFVGIDNIILDGQVALGRQRVKKALGLDPSGKKYRAMLVLSYLGRPLLKQVITLRRLFGRMGKETDYSLAPHWRIARQKLIE